MVTVLTKIYECTEVVQILLTLINVIGYKAFRRKYGFNQKYWDKGLIAKSTIRTSTNKFLVDT